MIYLATPSTVAVREAIANGRLGAMIQPASWPGVNLKLSERFPFVGLDNGCFHNEWEDTAWRRWLVEMAPLTAAVLFATVPDVVADHDATMGRFRIFASVVRDAGYPVAFVAQDGADWNTVPWSDIDCLFVGGSTAWKLSEPAWRIVSEARGRFKWVHVGRVNSFRRLRLCAANKVDSVDGTYLAWGPDLNLPRLLTWLDWCDRNAALDLHRRP